LNELFLQYEHQLAALQITLTMIGMGLILTPSDFVQFLKKPKLLIVSLILIFVVCPLLGLGLGKVMEIPAGFAMAFIVVGCLPGGAGSNLMVHVAKANVALSIALTCIGTLICLFYIPLIMQLTMTDYLPENIEFPTATVIKNMAFYLILPFAGSIYLKKHITNNIKWSKTILRSAMFILVLFVIGSLSSGRVNLADYTYQDMFKIIVLGLSFVVAGNFILLLMGKKDYDIVAVVVEMTLRNVGLGFIIVLSLFPPSIQQTQAAKDMMFCMLFFGGYGLGNGVIAIIINRTKLRLFPQDAP
jgi:BASS family bile acid:Na+ symporter